MSKKTTSAAGSQRPKRQSAIERKAMQLERLNVKLQALQAEMAKARLEATQKEERIAVDGAALLKILSSAPPEHLAMPVYLDGHDYAVRWNGRVSVSQGRIGLECD